MEKCRLQPELVRSTWAMQVCDSNRHRYSPSASNTVSVASLKITCHNVISVLTSFLPSQQCLGLKYMWLTWELSDHWCYSEEFQPFPPMKGAIPSSPAWSLGAFKGWMAPGPVSQPVCHTTSFRPIWKWWSGSKRQWPLDDWWSFVACWSNLGLIRDDSFDSVRPLYIQIVCFLLMGNHMILFSKIRCSTPDMFRLWQISWTNGTADDLPHLP